MSTPNENTWIQIAQFKKSSKLDDVEQFLNEHGIRHEWREETKVHSLWVSSEEEAQQVYEFLNRMWPVSVLAFLQEKSSQSAKSLFSLVPSTLSIVVICSLIFLLDWLDVASLHDALAFAPLDELGEHHQWWRLFTPALMHAGIFHIVFNMLWTWELGARIEYSLGTVNCCVIIIVSAVFSNLLQYAVSGSIYFLGYSGVVYAYLGFLWIYGKAKNAKILQIQDRIYYFMFIWLALGVFGLVDWLLPGNMKVANGAHVGGWVMGMILAKLFLWYEKLSGGSLPNARS